MWARDPSAPAGLPVTLLIPFSRASQHSQDKIREFIQPWLEAEFQSHLGNDQDGQRFREELQSIAQESDPTTAFHSLFIFAQRLEENDKPALAATIYAKLADGENISIPADVLARAQGRMKHLTRPGWTDIAKEVLLNIGPEDLVDVMIFHGAVKVSNLAKFGALKLLRGKLGLTSFPWIVVSRSAAVWAEASTIWGLGTLKQAAFHGTEEAFNTDTMLKNFAIISLTLRGIKTMGALGVVSSPALARFFKLTSADGRNLSLGGKVLTWGLVHTASLGGYLGVHRLIQEVGLAPIPEGGTTESEVRDVFTYLKFGMAQRSVARIFGKRYAASHEKLFQKVQALESEALAETSLKRNGFKVLERDASGRPVFIRAQGKTPSNPETPAPEPISDPWAHQFFTQLSEYQTKIPGFSGSKLMKLLTRNDWASLNRYLGNFSLKIVPDESAPLLTDSQP